MVNSWSQVWPQTSRFSRPTSSGWTSAWKSYYARVEQSGKLSKLVQFHQHYLDMNVLPMKHTLVDCVVAYAPFTGECGCAGDAFGLAGEFRLLSRSPNGFGVSSYAGVSVDMDVR